MIIGISGPSGSGKTTIARALRQVYAAHPHLCQSVQILHQDDFYKPEKDIPTLKTRAGTVTNWDCPEAVDLPALTRTLRTYRAHGTFPDQLKQELETRAKEDKNDVSETGVSSALLQRISQQLPTVKDLLIVDGFMLYQAPEILETLDLAILLRGSFNVLKERREARSGYVTLEGFWKDPDGYFEDCVWPEYVATHKQFFMEEDVHGTSRKHGRIIISDRVDMDLDQSLQFVVDAMKLHID